ncbi:MAG: SIMPL domain-containing protein [Pseudomonadota bacterium]
MANAQGQGGLALAALLLSIGVALGGYFVGEGFYEGRRAERYVKVKGLAERPVRADVASWPLRFTAAANELSVAQAQIDRYAELITDFLQKNGVPADDIQRQSLQVVDQLAQQYRQGAINGNRFIITQTIEVRTSLVDEVEALSRRTGELVSAGVVLSDAMGPTYSFTQLNAIKPEMIAEATRNARASAEQFAADAGSDVGEILRANQGVFQILPRAGADSYGMGEATQIEKRVRVVATLDFALSD